MSIKENQESYRRYLSQSTIQTREEYKQIRNETKKSVKQAHKKLWKRFVARIEHDVNGSQSTAYQVIKTLNKEEKDIINIQMIDPGVWK